MILLTCREAAARIGCDTEKIRQLIRAGRLPAIDLLQGKGGRPVYRLKEKDIKSYLERQAKLPYVKPQKARRR